VPYSSAYTDQDLGNAVQSSRSWRGVLRSLGLTATSAGSMRAARRRADALGLDYSHFTGQRTWSDAELALALASADSWQSVLNCLGLSSRGGGATTAIRAHAARLKLPVGHLGPKSPRTTPLPFATQPRLEKLRVAGPTFAAGWFMLCGHEVLWPLEPCRYDFVVATGGAFHRVQVKTATYRSASTSAVVSISTTRRTGRAVYGIDEIDYFFVIDGELNAYVIPIAAVAGYQQIYLRRYDAFRVAAGGRWLTDVVNQQTDGSAA
jgi:hypothetical protein